jgi:hypothetical protein
MRLAGLPRLVMGNRGSPLSDPVYPRHVVRGMNLPGNQSEPCQSPASPAPTFAVGIGSARPICSGIINATKENTAARIALLLGLTTPGRSPAFPKHRPNWDSSWTCQHQRCRCRLSRSSSLRLRPSLRPELRIRLHAGRGEASRPDNQSAATSLASSAACYSEEQGSFRKPFHCMACDRGLHLRPALSAQAALEMAATV